MPVNVVKTPEDEHKTKVYKIAHRDGKRSTGVYAAVYKITNSISGKLYVGKSQNVFARWRTHLKDLRNGVHVNRHLQNAWALYGEDVFDFEVLEYVYEVEMLAERELFYVTMYDSLDPEHGYNLNVVCGVSFYGFRGDS